MARGFYGQDELHHCRRVLEESQVREQADKVRRVKTYRTPERPPTCRPCLKLTRRPDDLAEQANGRTTVMVVGGRPLS